MLLLSLDFYVHKTCPRVGLSLGTGFVVGILHNLGQYNHITFEIFYHMDAFREVLF